MYSWELAVRGLSERRAALLAMLEARQSDNQENHRRSKFGSGRAEDAQVARPPPAIIR
jgi:hypothetical protein